jgi:hypothetical protein
VGRERARRIAKARRRRRRARRAMATTNSAEHDYPEILLLS